MDRDRECELALKLGRCIQKGQKESDIQKV